jgi:hypothetical protein
MNAMNKVRWQWMIGSLLFSMLAASGCDTAGLDGQDTVGDEVAEAQSELVYYPDTQPDPVPTAAELISPNAAVAIPPGYRACYPALSANNSAGIAGYVAYQGLYKAPRVLVYWARNFGTSLGKIYATTISPEATGYFQVLLNRYNGFAAYFPGVFEFCVKNPSVNAQPVYLNASVVTY